ncbi:MAG: hypothetical protein LBN05_03835, partial [Oscillospiraceae bacterium]|nr:hypothetical protein [Oscillospiraceae bacterium]
RRHEHPLQERNPRKIQHIPVEFGVQHATGRVASDADCELASAKTETGHGISASISPKMGAVYAKQRHS